MKPKNTFSKSAGFRQVIVLVGVMLAFTITSFALTSAARNEDGDGKETRWRRRRNRRRVDDPLRRTDHGRVEDWRQRDTLPKCGPL